MQQLQSLRSAAASQIVLQGEPHLTTRLRREDLGREGAVEGPVELTQVEQQPHGVGVDGLVPSRRAEPPKGEQRLVKRGVTWMDGDAERVETGELTPVHADGANERAHHE